MQQIRIVAAGAIFASALVLNPASVAAAIDECTPEEWDIAQCGFNSECYGEFGPPGCGTGFADVCYTIGGTVYFEGWCFPTEPEYCGGIIFC